MAKTPAQRFARDFAASGLPDKRGIIRSAPGRAGTPFFRPARPQTSVRGRHYHPLPHVCYFFSGSEPVPGLKLNELNIVLAWFCICSCICTNMFFDCSM